MKWLRIVLAERLRKGTLTIEIPGLDMQEFKHTLHGAAEQTLQQVADIACNDYLSDRQKIADIQELLF